MSSVLRHNADKFGLKMRPDGYAKVQDLLAMPKFRGQTFESIKAVVDSDEKKRYDLREEDETWVIRANQGHSMTMANSGVQTVKVEMEEIKDPQRIPMVVHGTTQHAWKSISTQGLSRMNRQHIHFAQGLPNDEGVISGMRKSCSVLIFVDLAKAMRAGHTFYLSMNGVVLTAGDDKGFLPREFFSRVEATKTGQPTDGFDGPRQPVGNTSAEEAKLTSGNAILATENVKADEDREAAEESWAAIAEQKNLTAT
ncbi:hypothetical protein AURDEDRAFT_119742 [Auricularia subglabra TFB-10046 SS5]|nr:hypothetical protein AURDEDRAFT_119742 [Auricularia subglabra TFB-10046 SS5]